MLLDGKNGLIIGVANKHSIAWAIAQSAANHGARLLFNFQNERLRENVEERVATMPGAKAFPCDVGDDAQIAALIENVGKETGKLDFLSLIDSVRAIESAHLEHIEAAAAFEKAFADLERAVGGPVERGMAQ